MKISLFSATLVAGVLAAGSFTLSALAQAPQGSGAQAPVGTSVAVIDVNYVFKNHQRFNAQMEDIKKDIKSFESFVRGKQNEITQEGEKLKEYKAGSPMYKQLEEKISRMQADLQVQMQLKRKEFLEAEARVYYNTYTELVDEVAQFAERYAIGLVLRFNGEQIDPQKRETVLQGVNRAVVYQNHLNISDSVLERLNRGGRPDSLGQRGPAIPPRTR